MKFFHLRCSLVPQIWSSSKNNSATLKTSQQIFTSYYSDWLKFKNLIIRVSSRKYWTQRNTTKMIAQGKGDNKFLQMVDIITRQGWTNHRKKDSDYRSLGKIYSNYRSWIDGEKMTRITNEARKMIRINFLKSFFSIISSFYFSKFQ